MHEQFAERALVELFDMDAPGRAAVPGERIGGGATLSRDEVADALAGEARLARALRQPLVHERPLPRDAGGHDGAELVVRPCEIELELAVLIDGADGGHRLGAVAVLADA